MTARVVSRQPVSVEAIWAERLGLVTALGLSNELRTRFETVARCVLDSGEMPPAGSAAFAVAYSDLWVLERFLADARRVLLGKEVKR